MSSSGGGGGTKRGQSSISYAESSGSEGESEDEAFVKKSAKAKKSSAKKARLEDETDEEMEEEENPDCESGRIKKIFLKDFMSHKKFTLDFGKNVNFVTGPNGSGKSAVVAALQVCLGSRMSSTGRGSALLSMIRQGSPGPGKKTVLL